MNGASWVNPIETSLKAAFPDARIEVTADQTVLDGSAVVVRVVSCLFDGMSKVKRHQLVYQQLGGYIASGELHAVKIIALTTQEDGS